MVVTLSFSLIYHIFFLKSTIIISGRKGILNCKLHWYPKFYGGKILLIGSKTRIVQTFQTIKEKLCLSSLGIFINSTPTVLSLKIPDNNRNTRRFNCIFPDVKIIYSQCNGVHRKLPWGRKLLPIYNSISTSFPHLSIIHIFIIFYFLCSPGWRKHRYPKFYKSTFLFVGSNLWLLLLKFYC